MEKLALAIDRRIRKNNGLITRFQKTNNLK